MDKSITFITCVNDEKQYLESLKYIENLNVPNEFDIDIISIGDAKSMTAGYNLAMKRSKSKYKVYLHQDVLIVNKNFIYDFLEVFKDPNVGMIGVIGSEKLPENNIWWQAEKKYGKVYESSSNIMLLLEEEKVLKNEKYKSVEAIDGLIMITQYDIPWREDLFDGFHFYDISQSFEFIKHEKKVVVPYQEKPWCLHNCGASMKEFFYYSKIFSYYKNY